MDTMKDEFNKAIDEAGFSTLELMGFSADPRLALLAGANIGYLLAIKFFQAETDKIKHKGNHLKSL